MCAPVTAVKQIYAVGCRRRRATIEAVDVDVRLLSRFDESVFPAAGPSPRLSSRCCACIVLLDDPSAIGLTGPLLLNTDQRLPEAIFMQQQSSAASTQAAEQDLETST